MGFTNFFLDNVPGYDKFRAVAMILVIAEFTLPLLAVLALNKMITESNFFAKYGKRFYYAAGLVLGLTLLITVSPGALTDFYTQDEYDQVAASVKQQNLGQEVLDNFMGNVAAAREAIVKQDAKRTLLFLLLACGLLWSFIRYRYDNRIFIFSLLFLILIDLGTVNARYLESSDFVRKSVNDEPFPITVADQALLQDTSSYRVLNLAVNTFNDASTAYRHQSIGGYHGAKMKRYQELIENCISGEIATLRAAMQNSSDPSFMQTMTNQPVLNMLNAKYIVYNPDAPPFTNFGSLGNAWFVPDYKIVANSDEEIAAVKSFNPSALMLVDKRYQQQLNGYRFVADSTASIVQRQYLPNHLTYEFNSSAERLVVFSEIYYDKGWKAYIDGKQVDHFRTNYVLRGMRVPAGKHTMEFKFEPEVINVGEKIAMASSALLLLMVVGVGFAEWKKSRSKA
jgi:hypothetical protein